MHGWQQLTAFSGHIDGAILSWLLKCGGAACPGVLAPQRRAVANCRTELGADGRGRQRTVSKSVDNRGYEVTTAGGRKSTMMTEIRRKETRPRRRGCGGLRLELCYWSQTLTLNGGTSGVHWRRRGCQRAVSCLCTSKCTRMSKYTLILTNQLTPPSQPMPMIMLSKAKWRSPDGFR